MLVNSILDTFSINEINTIAKTTGFCKKKKKTGSIDGVSFLKALLLNSEQDKNLSLRELCIELESEYGISITKQGLYQRFNESSILFIKTLFEKYLLRSSRNLPELKDRSNWTEMFKRILIKDGTRFDLPESFATNFVGSGGSASKSAVCIQFEYDLKTGKVHDISLTSANDADSKNAQLTKDKIQEGDLILRDLGYFGLNILEEMISKGAFFISKSHTSISIFEMRKGNYVPLNFKKLRQEMNRSKCLQMEKEVYIGRIQKIPTRLVIEKVPDKVYEERIRKKNKEAGKKKYKLSEEYKSRQYFNLYITNIKKDILPKEAIRNIYRLRWQVELVFKQWKSTYKIEITHPMSYERWMTLFYARMLIILINWQIYHTASSIKYNKDKKLLSIAKSLQTLRKKGKEIRNLIGKGIYKIRNVMVRLNDLISEGHLLEKKKEKIGLEKILEIKYCISVN